MWRTSFFWILTALSIFSWISWYIVLHNVSPVQSTDIAFPLFYSTLFFAITFTGALVMSLLWKACIPTKSSYMCLKNGIREGGMIGFATCIAIFFQQYQYLGWQEILLIVLLIVLLELFFVIQFR